MHTGFRRAVLAVGLLWSWPADAGTDLTVRGQYAFIRSDEKMTGGKVCNVTASHCVEARAIGENLLLAKVGAFEPELALVTIGGVEKAVLSSHPEPVRLESLYSAIVGALLALAGVLVGKWLDERLGKRRLRDVNASRFVGVCVSIIDQIDKSGVEFESLIKDAYQVEPETYFDQVREIRRTCEMRLANAISPEEAVKAIQSIMRRKRTR